MNLCERLESCGFFQTYGRQEGSSWRGFVACYCMGPLVDRCARRVLGLRHGVEPAPEIMPSGEAIS